MINKPYQKVAAAVIILLLPVAIFSFHKFNEPALMTPGTVSGSDEKLSVNVKEDTADTNRIGEVSQVWPTTDDGGFIGTSGDIPVDNPIDNVFLVQLNDTLSGNETAWLEYDLKGIEDFTGVSRGINGELSVGGYLVKKSDKWSRQREKINPSAVKQGENVIRFTVPSGAEYGYQVRNLAIKVDRGDREKTGERRLVVNQPASECYYGKLGYLQGYVTGDNSAGAKVMVNGEAIRYSGGTFESIVEKPAGSAERWSVDVVAQFPDGRKLSVEVTFKKPEAWDVQNGFIKEIHRAEQPVKAAEGFTLNLASATLKGLPGSVAENTELSVTALRDMDVPALDAGMVNVTAGFDGYRFLPDGTRFLKTVTLELGYDTTKIPDGYGVNDIRTYYFNEQSRHWVALDRDTAMLAQALVRSRTDHFTDYINAIIKVPESPETQGYTPTSMKDVKAANPAAGINLIEPPSANQMGNAGLSYPINIPAGRQGMQPGLGIQYNSGGGNGWLGLGWDLSIPSITVETRWGVPHYDPDKESETYIMGGEQLSPVAHRSAWVDRNKGENAFKYFYSRVEGSFSMINRHGAKPTEYWWEVTDKSGTKYFYGGLPEKGMLTGATLRDDDGNIASWSLVETRDLNDNFVRYYYTTVIDFGVAGGTLENGTMEGRQIYIDSITYTGHGTTEGLYKVVFRRDRQLENYKRRPDVTISAIRGFKEVTADLLRKIDVKFGNKKIRGYELKYREGAFYKTLLDSIIAYDAAEKRFGMHAFAYYDDVLKEGEYRPFKDEQKLEMPNSYARGYDPMSWASTNAIGGSRTKSWGAGTYVGFGLGTNVFTKSRTAGFDYDYDKSTTEGLLALVDIDGDGLSDRVFMNGSVLSYCRRLHDDQTKFSEAIPIEGEVKTFEYTESKSNKFGLGVYPSGKSFAGGSKSYTTTETSVYFTDANGDGLIDIVAGGRVYFNRIVNGKPYFSRNPAGTPAPIHSSAKVSSELDFSTLNEDEVKELKQKNPLQDAVKMWISPFAGIIKIKAPVHLTPPNPAIENKFPDGVQVSIQKNSEILWSKLITKDNFDKITPTGVDSLKISAGDRLFFRVHSIDNGFDDAVIWNPTIYYQGKDTTLTDPDRKPFYHYNAGKDFLLSGNYFFSPMIDGIINIESTFKKPPLSDDADVLILRKRKDVILPDTLYHYSYDWHTDTIQQIDTENVEVLNTDRIYFIIQTSSNVDWNKIEWKPYLYFTKSNDEETTEVMDEKGKPYFSAYPVVYCSLYPLFFNMGDIYTVPKSTDVLTVNAELKSRAGKTGSFELIAQKEDGGILGASLVSIEKGRYISDSTLKFNCSSGTHVNFILKGFTGISANDVSDSVLISSTNSLFKDLKHPVAKVFDYNPRTTISIKGEMIMPPVLPVGMDPRDIMSITVKTYDTLLAKSKVSYFSGIPTLKCNVYAGQKLFISYFTKSTIFFPYLNPEVKITINDKESKAKAFIYSTQPEDLFLLGNLYRGWGQFGYNGNNGFLPIDPNNLTIKDKNEGDKDFDETSLEGSNDMDDLGKKFNKGGGYDASSETFIAMRPDIEKNKWVGYDDFVFITPDTISSSRMGDKVITSGSYTPDPAETFFAPVKKNKSKTTAASANIFALGGSSSTTDSRMLTDYTDMNGDRFPDIISGGVIQYTSQTGGLSATTLKVGDVNNSTASTKGITAGGSIMKLSIPKVSKKPDMNLTGNMKKASISVSASFSNSTNEDIFTYLDINGDGLPDKIDKNGLVSLNLGYRFSAPESWGYENGIQKIDVTTKQGGAGFGGGSLSFDLETGEITGGSFQFSIKGESFMGGVGLYASKSNPSLVFMDVNSDGLADEVTCIKDTVFVKLNKGNGFVTNPIKWTVLGKLNENVSLNGSFNVAGTFGIPFTVAKLVFNPRVNLARTVSRAERQLMDFDGDGNLDFLASHDIKQLKVHSSTIARTNLLRSVKSPLGATIDLDYARVGNTYDMPQSQWVLSSVTVNDGHPGDGANRMLTTFEYENGYQDRYERSFYGFGKVITRQRNTQNADSVYRSTVQSYSNTTYFNKGLLVSELLEDAKGKKYTGSSNIYKMKDPKTMANLPADFEKQPTAIAYPALEESIKMFYEGKNDAVKTSKITFVYGPFGNVKTYTDMGDIGDASDDISAAIYYHNAKELLDKNIVSIPDSISVTGGGKVYRKRGTSVDNKTGDITAIRQYAGTGKPATWNMAYDEYGNLDSIVRPPNDKGQRMYFKYTYDPVVHSFVTDVKDALGYSSSASYDYSFGAVLGTKDLNGQQTKYTIDDAGRILTITGPYELASGKPFTIKFEYHSWDKIPWALTEHYDPANPSNNIETALFIDGLGRVLQTKKDGSLFESKRVADKEVMIVSGLVEYDAFGRAVKSYYPLTESHGRAGKFNPLHEEVVPPTAVTYDVMDRTLTTTLPDGAVTGTGYGFGKDRDGKMQLLTKVTDANGKVSETFTDVKGRQTAVKAPGDTWTSFIYDPVGQLVTATDPENNKTTSVYDMLGRRLSRNHPDAGVTEYVYDLSGNMTSQMTANLKAKNKAITYEYDYGRLTAIKYPENTYNNVRYEYGKPGDKYNRAGRMVMQEDASGAQEFFYGPLGEIVKNIRTITIPAGDVYTFTTSWEYDTWNRLTKMVYPDGEELTYSYNTGGLLKSMKGSKQGQTYNYLTRLGYDHFENRVYLSYGNGTDMTYSYEPDRRRLHNLTASTSGRRKMMDNTYSYDKVDNIVGLVNAAPMVTPNKKGGPFEYSYGYDDLYRLTDAEGDWKGATHEHRYSLDMQYSPTGRILKKTQTHDRMSYDEPDTWVKQHKTTYDLDYKYEGSQPHAATHIGENTYTYDANGNQTGWTNDKNGTRRQILWDEENRIRAIADNGVTHHYIYDASGERVIKANGDGQAIYVNGFPMGGSGTVGNYTMYVNPFMVVQNFKYTKHFYIEGQRIVSKLGEMGVDNGMFDPKAHAGDSLKTPVKWDGKKETSKATIIANFEALGLSGAVFTAGKSGKVPYGQIKKYFRNTDGQPVDRTTETTTKKVEGLQFYYHPDHLGSSNYITDASGEVYQHQEYFPFGETFVEERNDAEYTTYLFNGKELDEETGLYYYGARYYDPRISIFYGVDPLAEKFNWVTPYNYAENSPVSKIDLWGLQGINVNNPLVDDAPSIIGREHAMAVRKGIQGIVSMIFTGFSAVFSIENKLIGDLRHLAGFELGPGKFAPLLKLEFDKPDGTNSWDADIVPLSETNDPSEMIQNFNDDLIDALGTNPALPMSPKDALKSLTNDGLQQLNKIVKENKTENTVKNEENKEIKKEENNTIKE